MTQEHIERIKAACNNECEFELADACNPAAMTAVLAHIDAQAAEIEKANAVMDAYLVARLEDAKEIERLRGELHQHECNNFDAVREQRDFLLASQALLIESAKDGQDAQAAEIEALKLAEEGAKEAFGVIVQDKRDLEAECRKFQELLDRAYEIIRANAAGVTP